MHRGALLTSFLLAAFSPPPGSGTPRMEFVNGSFYLPDGVHPCDRECVSGQEPMTCEYKFEVEIYTTRGKVVFYSV